MLIFYLSLLLQEQLDSNLLEVGNIPLKAGMNMLRLPLVRELSHFSLEIYKPYTPLNLAKLKKKNQIVMLKTKDQFQDLSSKSQKPIFQ